VTNRILEITKDKTPKGKDPFYYQFGMGVKFDEKAWNEWGFDTRILSSGLFGLRGAMSRLSQDLHNHSGAFTALLNRKWKELHPTPPATV